MLKVMMFRQIENMSIILAMPYWLASESNVFVTMSEHYAPYVPIVFENY